MKKWASKPTVAVICGGNSSEQVISFQSGRNVFNAIQRERFTPWLVQMTGNDWHVYENEQQVAPVDKSDFSFVYNGEKIKFDFAYITIHGTPGEDGILQGYLELTGIPYSTCNLHTSSLTFNKWYCNNYLRGFNISMAKTILVPRGGRVEIKKIISELGMPLFVKPNAGGSSFGVTKVKREEDLMDALRLAWTESDEALVDEFIAGTEYTCGLVKIGKRTIIFPLTEVIPKNEFFDFDAKYTPGLTEEITPARLPEKLAKECRDLSSRIYTLCGCSGIVRIDYILHKNSFYLLEVNTTPGMTATSFIPQQIRAMGKTLGEILTLVIDEKLKNRG